jgi:hypothetical protein
LGGDLVSRRLGPAEDRETIRLAAAYDAWLRGEDQPRYDDERLRTSAEAVAEADRLCGAHGYLKSFGGDS